MSTNDDTSRRLDALEALVQQARASSEDEPMAEARRLTVIERDLLAVTGLAALEDPDLADDRGHPVLADLGHWRTRCAAAGLKAEEDRSSELLNRLVEDESSRWQEAARAAAADGSAQDLIDLLGEASVLDREAMRREGETPGPPPLEGERELARKALLDRLAARPPTAADFNRWTTDLLDGADVVLTGIDEMGPAAAAAQLRVAANDLIWFVGHVATKKGRGRRRLRRKIRRLRAEIQERGLHGRLEGMFGFRSVARFERLVIILIFVVLGLLAVEMIFQPPTIVVYWFTIIDTVACLIFLWDFFFRLWLVKGKGAWFLRHFLIDLLPSIPIGLLTLSPGGPDPIRAGRALRLMRVARIARSVRFLMPAIRLVRALGFLTRGLDRIVRRYGHLLNRDVILYPTREEKTRALATEGETAVRLRRLQSEVTDLWEDLLLSAERKHVARVAGARIEALAQARRDGLTARPTTRRAHASVTREVPADSLLRRLEGATAEGVAADLGPDFVTRTARVVRLFARAPLRWIPFLGRLFPRLGPAMSDAEVVAVGAQHAAGRLRRYLDRWYFFADLHGTVTPAEFVDRVGSTMVRSASRPAYRLAMIGGIFLLVQLLLVMAPWDLFHWIANRLGPLVGDTLLLLGGICLIVLGIGWWLRRLAREATTFFEQVALAQFLPLTESIKGRFLERDADILCRRVIDPECLLLGDSPYEKCGERRSRFVEGVKGWLLQAHSGGDAIGAFDAMERTLLLHRDGMDGGLLHASDTRTTNQLLGNPALRRLVELAGCVTPKEQKELTALDLEYQRRLLGGPYLWFNLVTRAVAQSAARLIVDYNRHAIPLVELDALRDEDRVAYETWLASEPAGDQQANGKAAARLDTGYVTAAFTALHILDDDERRDLEVKNRFGERVLGRLQADRRRLFRRIFGTFPLHLRPHEKRVVNLYRFYERWFASGRALLLPLRGLWAAVKWIGRVVGWVVKAVGEIRHPPIATDDDRGAEADYAAAVRKIDRMRGPLVRACLRLRIRMDVEYLGVRLPGTRRTGLEGVQAERDLAFLEAPVRMRLEVEEEHDRAQADMRRLDQLIDAGLMARIAATLGVPAGATGREHLRAAAFAYRADLDGVRSNLSGHAVLMETSQQVVHRPVPPGRLWSCLSLRLPFWKWWKAHGSDGRLAKRAAWRAVVHDVNGVQRALRAWSSRGGEQAQAEGEARLTEMLRHPGRISGQLVTLRAVSTLALLDVLNYREHVWRLGGYAEDGEDPRRLLTLQEARQQTATVQ